MVLARLLIILTGTLAAAFIAHAVQVYLFGLVADEHGTVDMLKPGAEAGTLGSFFAEIAVFVLIITLLVKAVYHRRPYDRAFVVIGSYALASVALPLVGAILMGVFSTFGYVLSETGQTSPNLGGVIFYALWIGLYWCVPSAAYGLVASVPLMVVAELKKIRALLFYILAGGIVALVGRIVFALFNIDRTDYWHGPLSTWAPIAIAGMIVGAVYWALAGRNAGTWPEHNAAETQTAASA